MANTVRITAANWYTKWKKPHKQEVEGAFPLIFEFYERALPLWSQQIPPPMSIFRSRSRRCPPTWVAIGSRYSGNERDDVAL